MTDPEAALASLIAWAQQDPEISGILLVGSRARGTHRPDSDLDLVLSAQDRERYLENRDWLKPLGPAGPMTREEWGVPPGWAEVNPVDPGTARVVRDGARILFDPSGVLARLLAAVQPEPDSKSNRGLPRSERIPQRERERRQ